MAINSKQYRDEVQWYVPNKKRPIAYSTEATSDLIAGLSWQYETIYDVYNAVNYDVDAKEILQKYIDLGYGNEIARNWFV